MRNPSSLLAWFRPAFRPPKPGRRAAFVGFTPLLLGVALALATPLEHAYSRDGNRLAYLDHPDPYYPDLKLARFTTPQWVGEEGVDAVVIVSIDDLREPAKYEAYLRPILERLKQIDGRAPVSIMCNELDPTHPPFQHWLKEGVSLEAHTQSHPCPLLGKAGFESARHDYHANVDLLSKIPGNTPVAFRMPCCDSMNSASPRFFAEIFSQQSSQGRALAIDSSVMCLLTDADPGLPRELVIDSAGHERFRKYFPMEMRPPRKRTFERFGGYIENYPYPYVVGRGGWEFPCMVPSDWEQFNILGEKNPQTTQDWKAALDAVVLKQGVMTMVLHPHGWSDPQQIVELIDHATERYGRRVKFLNFPEALARLEKHALAGNTLRGKSASDNGVRLLDLNGDGYMDVLIGNADRKLTRIWDPDKRIWKDSPPPFLISEALALGMVEEKVIAVQGKPQTRAWRFTDAGWKEVPSLAAGLPPAIDRGSLTFRDFDGDGTCEALVNTPGKTIIHRFSPEKKEWEPAAYSLPEHAAVLNEDGRDNGLRFADLNEDGHLDVLVSNEHRFGIHLWAKNVRPDLGWAEGWSQLVRAGERKGAPNEPPAIVREGANRNNGAWFRGSALFVQNEDTAHLENVVDLRTFKELIAFDIPPPRTPEESLSLFQVHPGMKVELVAAEPLVVDPIAFDWDASGRLWVVEMRDYPLGIDGKGKPGGVIKRLDDTDGDGRYDRATTFLKDLLCPTGIIPWKDGVLISAAPDILFARDTDGDGVADQREVLFTGFSLGNEQHRINGFDRGLDGWIYGANGDSGGTIRSIKTGKEVSINGRDFRFRPETGEFEAESGATQHGRWRDDWGEWFGNNNSAWLWHYTIADHYLRRNPRLPVKSVRKTLANYPHNSRVHAISKQPIRFNQPQSLGHVTSACNPVPYRDDLFGPEFESSVFVCEPVHNAVHREVIKPHGASFTSARAESDGEREFLASSDVWFRPTLARTGPDGALYVSDMYRFVLEHPEWISPETQARLDLRAGEDKGRIYRIAPMDQPRRSVPNLSKLDTAGLVRAMESPNGWQRDTVQRLLEERKDATAVAGLEEVVRTSKNPKVRVQALATLDLLEAASPAIVTAALRDPHPLVRTNALRVSESVAGQSEALADSVAALASDPEFVVRRQLAFTLGAFPRKGADPTLEKLAAREGGNAEMRLAILSSVPPDHSLMKKLVERPADQDGVPAAPTVVATTGDRAKVVKSYLAELKASGDAAQGKLVFQQNCAACHRFKNEGREIGPELAMVSSKPADWLITAIFDPNQAVEPRYQAQKATLKNQQMVVGLIAGETANNVTIRTVDGAERAVLREDLEDLRPLGQSLMPEGLESVLRFEDVANLLSYLREP